MKTIFKRGSKLKGPKQFGSFSSITLEISPWILWLLVRPLFVSKAVGLCGWAVKCSCVGCGCKIMQGAVLLTAQPLRVKLLWSSDTSRGNQSATAGTGNPSLMAAAGPKWAQKTVMLPPHRRGCHLITPKVINWFSSPT